MSSKSLLLSSSGLKNVVLNNFNEEDDFILIFGENQIRMKSFFAEFISPIISKIHQTDPTIKYIDFGNFYSDKKSEFNKFTKDLISKETITQLQQISQGIPIEINRDQSFKLQYLSNILGNEELFSKLDEIYPQELVEENINIYLKNAQLCYNFSQFSPNFNYLNILNFLSNHFYLLDEEEFLKLPRGLQYSIISNPFLQINSEDSLYDIIYQILSQNEENERKENKEKDDQYIDDIYFLEQIEYAELSEEKLMNFLNEFDITEITSSLWQKLFQCFFKRTSTQRNHNKSRHLYKYHLIEFDPNSINKFNGILKWLGEGKATNALNKGFVDVTSSSVFGDDDFLQPKNVLDYDDDSLIFQSKDESSPWLCVDFINCKVCPSHYSLKSTNRGHKGHYHPQSWDIQGSNDAVNWDVLDSRRNDKSLDHRAVSKSFEITNVDNQNKYYRYIRIVQKDLNSGHTKAFIFASIEFFGSIKKE